MAVRIVTDSSCCITDDMAEELGITVIPICVQLEGASYKEGTEITTKQFYDKIAEGIMPKTSSPSPVDIHNTFKEIVDAGDSIIAIFLSSKASSTYNLAINVAEDFPDAQIDIFDSLALTYIQGFIVKEVAQAVQAGRTHEEVMEVARVARENVFGFLTMPTLKYISKSGRVTKGAAILGSILNIKPIMRFELGELAVTEKIRTFPQALKRAVELTQQEFEGVQDFEVAVMHCNDYETGVQVKIMLEVALGIEDIPVEEAGSVIGAHGGPGMIVITGLKRDQLNRI